MKTLLTILLAVTFTIISTSDVSALMSSSNFRIYGDSIGASGGRASSASYILQATTGEDAAGEASSTSYTLMTGFQSLSEHPTFTFALSANSVDLGDIVDSGVSSGSVVLTTSTNAPFGYTTTVVEDGNLRSGANDINDVADGSVTAGSEEYGIAVSGTDASFGTDQPITASPLTIASRDKWKNGAELTVTHKASINNSSSAGSYSHEITYISTGNF